jgi:hypothetical protein
MDKGLSKIFYRLVPKTAWPLLTINIHVGVVWHVKAYKSVKDIHIVTPFGTHVANTVKTQHMQENSYRPHGGNITAHVYSTSQRFGHTNSFNNCLKNVLFSTL